MGRLTTHVLDTATGLPAAGLSLSLWALDGAGGRRLVKEAVTNDDGRVDAPLLEADAFVAGRYEIVFRVADHFRASGVALADPAFLDEVPIRFGVADASRHVHVPLLLSPYGYTTYRGS